MVIDYRRLNDNTVDDAYDILDKTELINKIQNSNVFSKFDCKSGFWQIKMHKDSISWTAFTCPLGHYEWLVMPFGLKNAPSILWLSFKDRIINKNYRITFEHIHGKDNDLADNLSRCVYFEQQVQEEPP